MEGIFTRTAQRYRQFRDSVSAPHAKPPLRQIAEIVRLRRGRAKLSAAQYFWMNLGHSRLYEGVDLESFGGAYHTEGLHKRLNSPYWDAVVTDKLIMSSVFERCGIPQPTLYAAACRFPRKMGDLPVFSKRDDLIAFIHNGIAYPFFCKPIKGGSAKGCNRVERYRKNGMLQLASGREISVETFVDELKDPEGWGFLFQEAVGARAETQSLCGESVSGCRVIMLVGDDKPEVFRVVWKLPAKGNYVDNFVRGTTGNMLADIDPDSGRVSRIVAGTHNALKINPPGEASAWIGRQLPLWHELVEMMKTAAVCFPGFRFQHWDVGLASAGPVVYELNTAGDLYLTELAKGQGVFDSKMLGFLERYDNQSSRRHFAGCSPVL